MPAPTHTPGLLQMQLICTVVRPTLEVKYGNMGLPDIDSKMLMGINVAHRRPALHARAHQVHRGRPLPGLGCPHSNPEGCKGCWTRSLSSLVFLRGWGEDFTELEG